MKNVDWTILKTLYEKQSMTKAAETLYMTQSALTKRIQAIEAEWGIQVVKRNSKGVTFTDDGKYLVNKANIMLDFLREIEDHFTEHGGNQELIEIGVPNSFARLHMPELLRQYQLEGGNLQIKTVVNSSNVLIKQITDESLDLAFICGDYSYIGEKTRLFEENLYVAAPKGKKLDDLENLPFISAYLNPMVKLSVEQWWKSQFGSPLHATYSVTNADIAIEMVEKGLGMTFVFGDKWRINEDEVTLYPVYDRAENPISRNVWMMVAPRCYQSQEIMDFVSFVEKYYQAN